MAILPNEKKALNDLRSVLIEKYSLLDFKVFGSKAKGTDIQSSDLDVMIVIEDNSQRIESEIDDLIFELNLKYDCFITALFFGQKELEKGHVIQSPIYRKILREGISI